MNIYVAGAINNEEILVVYDFIKVEFSKLGHVVKTSIDTIEYCKTHNEKERFDKAMKDISAADVVISEISGPSCGHGFEVGVLYSKGFKNVILITSNSTYTSGILIGAYGKPIKYSLDNLTELNSQLLERIKKFKAGK